jgi:hypothetical protein
VDVGGVAAQLGDLLAAGDVDQAEAASGPPLAWRS